MLLETRAKVLGEFALVETATSLTEMERLRGKHDIRVVLLCHTVRQPERNEAVALARSIWPATSFLLLTSADPDMDKLAEIGQEADHFWFSRGR